MWAVIDAQVFQQYYATSINGTPCALTDDPVKVFDSSPDDMLLFMDEGALIEQEWRNLSDHLWFDKWLTHELTRGKVRQIPVAAENELRRKLGLLGFPNRRSRDIWYIRTAKQTLKIAGAPPSAVLVSEDLDFYEPSEKGCASVRRLRLLNNSGGSVARFLRRELAIEVRCVANV